MIIQCSKYDIELSKYGTIMSIQLSKRLRKMKDANMVATRYASNPFTKELVVNSKKQRLRVSNSAKLNDETWINNTTGELATTQLYTYKEVDETQFVKLFTQNIALTFNLTSAGIKSLNVLIWAVQFKAINKDMVILDEFTLINFLAENSSINLSRPTFSRGLVELEKAKIIARCLKRGDYFINPNFVFNGDRLLFVNAIRKKSTTTLEDEQLELEL